MSDESKRTRSSGQAEIPVETPSGGLSRFASGPAKGKGEAARPIDDPANRTSLVRVEDHGVHRPFMLGIMVHSLTESGLDFEDAYEISRAVWRRIRNQKRVTKKELASLVNELSGAVPAERVGPALEDTLDVLGPNGRWPFNQARIQQSLLASAIRPREAFEVVLDIERELRRRGEREVSRDAIRALADEILSRRFGDETASLYRAWRRFQSSNRPVVVLLGGTSGVGKSSLALEVARRLSIGRVLSTDSIRDIMRMMISEELVPTLHVSSFEAHKRFSSDGREVGDPVVEGFLEQSRTVGVGVRAVIERAVLEETSTVLDGVSLVPGMVDLSAWQDRAQVFFMLAADFDRESLHGHLIARAEGGGARASQRYVKSFQEIFRIQEDLLERAEAHDVPIVDVQDIEVAVQQVVGHVVGQLRDDDVDAALQSPG